MIPLMAVALLTAQAGDGGAKVQAMEMAEIGRRLSVVFRDHRVSPRVEVGADRLEAAFGLKKRQVDITQFIIDRRPNRPRQVSEQEVPIGKGFRLSVERTRHIPQLLTQFVAPPGPELQRFEHRSPKGELLSVQRWYGPKSLWHELPEPVLLYSIETGAKVEEAFVRDVRAAIEGR
ncbi:MAG: hypothetical protein HYZ28_02450 [Myxococcales bacterium]|nr:hypothetical protein [Myxococcales bacterium]